MDDFEDAPSIKDFGPNTSLRKRRIWGSACLVFVFAFFGGITIFLNGPSTIEGGISFAVDGTETPPFWALALGMGTVLAISIGAPILADKLPKIEDKSGD